MTDLISTFADRFESNITSQQNQQNQPVTDMVSARMQRLQDLEQTRREHASSVVSTTDAGSRHSRRDRFVRQTPQGRSMERRNFIGNIQRTPVIRSASFDTPSTNAHEESASFREMFESRRQNLYSSRLSGSNENLTSGSLFSRRQSDTPENAGSNSGSGSNTPVPSHRDQFDQTAGIAEAFSSVRMSLGLGSSNSISETNIATREQRSSSMTREVRNPSTNYQRFLMSNTSPSNLSSSMSSSNTASALTRTSSLRESRSRFRRRTIQGVDSNVREALDIDRQRVHADTDSFTQALTSQRTQSSETLASSRSISEMNSVVQSKEETSSYRSSYKYKSPVIEVYPQDGQPVLALLDEKMLFVDNQGKSHWLDKHHKLARAIKGTDNVPEFIIKPLQPVQDDGVVANIEGDSETRINKLREIMLQPKQKAIEYKKDTDINEADIELMDIDDIFKMYDEKYKTVSYYTPPRERPNVENYNTSRTILTVYDGIDKTEMEKDNDDTDSKTFERFQTTQSRVGKTYSFPSSYSHLASSLSNTSSTNSRVESSNGSKSFSETFQQRRQQNLIQTQNETFARDMQQEQNSMSYQTPQSRMSMQNERQAFQSSYSGPDGYGHETFSQSASQSHMETVEDGGEADQILSNFQMMHENTGVALDTSHLDLDELRMIQQVLNENPSPPYSPSPPGSPVEYVTYEEYQPVITHENYQPIEIQPSEMQTIVEVPSPLSSGPPTPARSRLSSENPERRLLLPSMDFSPLERNQSPEKFTFSSNDANQIQVKETVIQHRSMTEEEYLNEQQNSDHLDRMTAAINRNGNQHQNELTIQIPGTSESTQDSTYRIDPNKPDSGSGSSTTKSSVSPLVKSESDSLNDSPSETVTEVFEEFASTVTEELLSTLPASQLEDN